MKRKTWLKIKMVIGVIFFLYAIVNLIGLLPPKGLEGDAKALFYFINTFAGIGFFVPAKVTLEEIEEIENGSFMSFGNN